MISRSGPRWLAAAGRGALGRNRALQRGVVAACLLACVLAAPLLAAGEETVVETREGGAGELVVDGVSMVEIPIPNLEPEDDAVRAQLLELRSEVDEALGLAGDAGASAERSRSQVAQALGELGALYYYYDLRDVAMASLTNAARLAPSEPRWRYLLGVLNRLEGRLDAAEQEYDEAMRLAPEATWTRYRRGRVRFDQARYQEALADFQWVLERDPDHAAALGALGNVLVRLGRAEEALEALERALELQPQASSLNYGLGLSLRALGRVDEARAALGRNQHGRPAFFDPWIAEIENRSVNREALFHAGNRAMRTGAVDDAIRYFESFLAEEPDHRAARISLAVAYIDSGREREGLEYLARLIEEDPESRGGARLMADTLADLGRLEEALPYFERAVAQDPDELTLVADWATVLATLGRSEEALERLGPLIQDRPQEAYARLKYATILATTPRGEEARPLLEELARAPGLRDELRAEAWYHLGSLDLQAGREDEALSAWQQALELDPESRQALAALAPAMARSGDLPASADLHRRWVEQVPRDERAQFGLAMALLLDGQQTEARSALEQALEVLPDQAALAHLLARLLATASDPDNRDGERAVTLARGLLQTSPGPDVAETLAMAFAEIGDFEQAVRLQEQVVERSRQRGEPEAAISARERRLEGYRQARPVRDPWRGGS